MNKYDELYETHRPHDLVKHRTANTRHIIMLSVIAVISFSATYAFGTPWTDEKGNPNPECYSQQCHETGVKDAPLGDKKPKHRPDNWKPHTPTPEVHNGFSCAYNGNWVYHTAARFNMTPEHDAAAKAEALARLVRLGDKAKDMKCRPWMIRSGFKIAGVM
jgi:hypothetical protein